MKHAKSLLVVFPPHELIFPGESFIFFNEFKTRSLISLSRVLFEFRGVKENNFNLSSSVFHWGSERIMGLDISRGSLRFSAVTRYSHIHILKIANRVGVKI